MSEEYQKLKAWIQQEGNVKHTGELYIPLVSELPDTPSDPNSPAYVQYQDSNWEWNVQLQQWQKSGGSSDDASFSNNDDFAE